MTDQPIYFISEAARYLRLPISTVHAWSMGRNVNGRRTPSLIAPADPESPLLSFLNLVELHILGSLRAIHGLKPKAIRKGLDYLKRHMRVERPLLDQAMKTDGKSLFIEWYGQNVDISSGGHLTLWASDLSLRLDRIDRDSSGVSRRLFPFTRTSNENTPKLIALNPKIRLGRPCITGTRLATDVIAGRHRAGDSIALLASDYERDAEEIEEAIRYESRAAA